MSYNETTKFCTQEDIIAEDWYSILNCNMNSTQDEIEAAYKKLVKIYHPDKNKDESAIHVFYKINSAYQILSDREIRAYYDYESGNLNSNENFRFSADNDIVFFLEYVDDLTGNKISNETSKDDLWNNIKNNIEDKQKFKRKTNIVATMDIVKSELINNGVRTAFPLYRYKTCGICRGVGMIGIDSREYCYNCEGYGIEEERIFVYVEIPKKFDANKLLKIPGRGHKTPINIGDLIIKINLVNRFGIKSKLFEKKNKNTEED